MSGDENAEEGEGGGEVAMDEGEVDKVDQEEMVLRRPYDDQLFGGEEDGDRR